MNTKHKILILLLAIIILGYVSTGFVKRTDVAIVDFTLSPDGTQMTIRTGVMSSAGYVRDISVKKDGDVLKLSFYKTFSGINNKHGAKNEFTFELPDNINEIHVYRDRYNYSVALAKNISGQWERNTPA